MIADDEVGFAVAQDADRAPTLMHFSAQPGVLFAFGVVIDVAHHVDDFAGNFCAARCVLGGLLRQRKG